MRRALPGGLELDDDRARVDVDAVHSYLSEESYWAKGRSREIVDRRGTLHDVLLGPQVHLPPGLAPTTRGSAREQALMDPVG